MTHCDYCGNAVVMPEDVQANPPMVGTSEGPFFLCSTRCKNDLLAEIRMYRRTKETT